MVDDINNRYSILKHKLNPPKILEKVAKSIHRSHLFVEVFILSLYPRIVSN